MNRRVALRILALSLTTIATRLGAKQSDGVPVIGLLVTHAAADDPIFDHLRAGLRERGYVDGRTIRLEIVTAEGKLDRLPGLARELIRRNAQLIIAPNEMSTRAALEATRTIPIVMIGGLGYDPVKLGFIDSFARPGGNITGSYGLWSEVEVKLLEVLKDIMPSASVVAVLLEPQYGRSALPGLQRAAQSLDLRLEPIEVRTPADLSEALNTAQQKSADAVIHLTSPMFYVERTCLGWLSLRAGLPVISPMAVVSSESGALISYGTDEKVAWRRVAYYVDRLLKGEPAGKLPVEQTLKLKFVVNLKTASALGITVPESILLRADEVIR
jgi:putative ABC transport system substrate-binding protein